MKTEKQYLDEVAQALHPYWPSGSSNTYLPHQLPQMIKALHNRIAELDADMTRLEQQLRDYETALELQNEK